jgi:hypothetical protein
MINKLIAALFTCIFVVSACFAAGPEGSGSTDQGSPEMMEGGASGADSGNNSEDAGSQKEMETETEMNPGDHPELEPNENQNENLAGNGQGSVNANELREQIKEREGILNQSSNGQSQSLKNQNQVRVAVHAFLALENVAGIGQNVSQIAMQFNNSVDKTVRAEEKITSRNGFARLLFGGDETAAAEIESEVLQNRVRVQQLNQILAECECDSESKQVLQEQLRLMEQEQDRLDNLSKEEKQNKGIFGWLWK